MKKLFLGLSVIVVTIALVLIVSLSTEAKTEKSEPKPESKVETKLNSKADAKVEPKNEFVTICVDVKDRNGNIVLNNNGKPKQHCRTMKVHKKLEGKEVPGQKK
jgi:hypothetical protein